jgi:hypothetical protein
MLSTCLSCQILMELEMSQQIFEKCSDITFNENLSSGSPVIPCGLTFRQTDMMKLLVAFHSFANVPKSGLYKRHGRVRIIERNRSIRQANPLFG